VSRKGGTGKTTIATHLAVAGAEKGLKTLLADLDPQQSALEWGRLREGLGPRFNARLEVQACPLDGVFGRWMQARREERDLMIIDTRPSADADIVEAMRSADACLMVVRPNHFDLAAVAETAGLARRLRKRCLIVFNQAPPRRNGYEPESVREAYESMRDLGFPVLSVGIRNRLIFQQAVRFGLAAQEVEPRSYAASEIRQVWKEVERALWAEQNDRAVEDFPRFTRLA
jgi:chromosome partitioning protein